MTVLVLTRPLLDATADLVISELHERGVPVHRLDPGEFPQELTVSAYLDDGGEDWRGTWRGQHRDLTLEDITAVYYRRPGRFRLHPSLSAGDARWAFEEARHGFGGVLSSLRCTWVNHPWRNALADYAPHALAVARRCGLPVPRTLITNDPEQAHAFVRTLPGGVAAYKPLGTAGPVGEDGEAVAVWTSRVGAEEIADTVALTTHLFQEWVSKEYEVRLTAVGGRMFAAEIHAGSAASRVDFRRDYDALAYRVCEVPTHIRRSVTKMMATLGLRYVALDFLVGQGAHRWYLVDVNPGGQYGFVPELCDPITRALADVLEGKAP
ncbi:ATP-grasp ribosomal peptide maturase [Streptomyces sp. UNOC14_S4]|uniref:ATP-grasp ribosomal peptide maturase n=1 Tax=Streptomyces sp. UNOC14_S4 TaxID=2872340 RepID=UPI001E441065|nr:ATP-grasp ribosomal peptide maturase [Streptomyces sp. UNOC14_S4]MCC3768179.1 ATP-grasp ribosomal peptide maturase [Streptomyces sp. UNOC14_S4]